MAFGNVLTEDDRREPRQTVFLRTRIRQVNGQDASVTIVNVSPRGFMARSDAEHADGDLVSVRLPLIGLLDAEVRWALGGRIGCRLMHPIALTDYEEMLALIQRGMAATSARP